MTVAKPLKPWKPPRPKPELQPATDAQAREYMSWFVNRRAYTRQKDKPDSESGRYFFYQARNFETKERLGLDTEIVRKHLAGEMTIGLYAINPKTQSSKWDDGGTSSDPGCDDMAIILVRQVHGWDMFLAPVYHSHRHCLVHQSTCVLGALYRDGWRRSRQVSSPFVVDHVRPASFDEAVNSSLHNDVPEMERIKDAGIENRNGGLKRHIAA